VDEAAVSDAPGPVRGRLVGALRVALALVGGSQLFLGLVQMTAYLPAPAHGAPASALVPVLTAFVGILTVLSANDFWSGRVEPARLASHALVVAGYLI